MTRPAYKTRTVFLHHCPRDVSVRRPRLLQHTCLWHHFPRSTNQFDLLRAPTVLYKSTLCGSGNVHSVSVCDEVFVRPLRFAKQSSKTPAASELLLRDSWSFPEDLLTQLGHFSSVWPSFDGGMAESRQAGFCPKFTNRQACRTTHGTVESVMLISICNT